MTVLEVIQRSTDYLAKKGIESPRLQAELLLADLLSMPRMKLYLNFDRLLSEEEVARMRERVMRRSSREPLQHIVGSVSFCGLQIMVSPAVLIPRPETEILVELALREIEKTQARLAIDFGTGSGCIAIALAARCPDLLLHALDISSAALAVARANAAACAVQDQIQFNESTGFANLDRSIRADIIVSNPPYIPSALIDALEPEVRDHDPRPALDGGPEGTDYFKILAVEGKGFIRGGGCLVAEFSDDQGAAVMAIFAAAGWVDARLVEDLSGRDRFIVTYLPAQLG